jgi:hypothetical protein
VASGRPHTSQWGLPSAGRPSPIPAAEYTTGPALPFVVEGKLDGVERKASATTVWAVKDRD